MKKSVFTKLSAFAYFIFGYIFYSIANDMLHVMNLDEHVIKGIDMFILFVGIVLAFICYSIIYIENKKNKSNGACAS